jgi:antitoxin HicB
MPAQSTIKILLSNAMIVNGVRKSDLARRLRIHMPQVDRLLDIRHASRLDTLEAAFEAVGKRLEVRAA